MSASNLGAAVLVVATTAAMGCGSGAGCPAPSGGNEPAFSVSVAARSFFYESFTSSANNDCPADAATVVSVTVGGRQVGSGFPITLCLLRPDLLGTAPIALNDTALVQVVDVSARDDQGCTYRLDVNAVPSGTVVLDGYCREPGHVYDVVFAGQVPGQRTCTPVTEPVTLVLAGRAPVLAR